MEVGRQLHAPAALSPVPSETSGKVASNVRFPRGLPRAWRCSGGRPDVTCGRPWQEGIPQPLLTLCLWSANSELIWCSCGDSLFMLVLLPSLCNVWMLAVFPMLRRHILTSSSRFKRVGRVIITAITRFRHRTRTWAIRFHVPSSHYFYVWHK
jgi:hypothetical protein